MSLSTRLRSEVVAAGIGALATILIVIALGYTGPGTPTGSPWSVTAHAAPAALTDSPHGRELESIATVVVTNRSSHTQRLHRFIIWLANPDGSYWTGVTTISLLCNNVDFPDFNSGAIGTPTDPLVPAGHTVTYRLALRADSGCAGRAPSLAGTAS